MKHLLMTLVYPATNLLNGWASNYAENKFAFEWNQYLQNWNLMVSHDTWAAQEVQLLAEK